MIPFDKPLFDQHDAHIRTFIDLHADDEGWMAGSPRYLASQMLSTETRVKKSLGKLLQAGLIEQQERSNPTLQRPDIYRNVDQA